MARTLTPQDCHVILNALVKQATGQTDIVVTDTSSFISAGEKLLNTATPENILNSLTLVIGRTIVAARPYTSPLNIIRSENSDMYTSRLRKISYYSKEALASGDFNTQLKTNFAAGYDNGSNGGQSTASMWEQNPMIPLELSFGGSSTWEDCFTVYKYQLKTAFRSEAEFGDFVQGWAVEFANMLESQKEAYDRMVMLNGIAGCIAMDEGGSVINLTTLFNDTYSTAYTTEELLTTYKTEFMKFFVSQFKQTVKKMAHRSTHYHWSVPKTIGSDTYNILRHSSKDNLRTILYDPFFIDATATVFPEIFNPQYLDLNTQAQMVDFWQADDTPSAINIKPVVVNKSTLVSEAASAAVSVPYVLGVIYDKDYMMSSYMMDDAESTPMEARKRYYNVWYSMVRNGIVDYTENCCVFIMKDE